MNGEVLEKVREFIYLETIASFSSGEMEVAVRYRLNEEKNNGTLGFLQRSTVLLVDTKVGIFGREGGGENDSCHYCYKFPE